MMTRRSALAAMAVLASTPPLDCARANAPLTVFELRHYRTQPRRREDLIAMFERYFLDAYTRAGATILGTFRNADDPDRWFWIRAFPAMPARDVALKGFYGSQDWLSRRDECNATILDVSDAFLMRTEAASTLNLPGSPAEAAIAPSSAQSLIEMTIYPLRPERAAAFPEIFMSQVLPLLRSDGDIPSLILSPEPLDGLTPKPAVRDDPALITLVRHDTAAAHVTRVLARRSSTSWLDINLIAGPFLSGVVETVRLMPTDRSWLR